MHFPGGHKYGTNNIPSIFPRKDLKSGKIVWPVNISSLQQDKDKNKSASTTSVDSMNITAKTVSVKENFPLQGKSDNDNINYYNGYTKVMSRNIHRMLCPEEDLVISWRLMSYF